jgi:molybdate transport system substrate-binding protein
MECVDVYSGYTGVSFNESYMTSPEIKRVMEGNGIRPDILIAPATYMDKFRVAGLLDGCSLTRVGDVDVGVAVRDGAEFPNLSSVYALSEAILTADRVLYNGVLSGQYIANMIKELGIAGDVADKTEVFPNASELMKRIGRGQGKEIGFGQIPAIRRLSEHGVVLVGPLPDELKNTTTYVAAATNIKGSKNIKGFLRFVATPRGREILIRAGVV